MRSKLRKGSCVLVDADYLSSVVRKNHIERDIGILLPKCQWLLVVENKKHPVVFRHVVSPHQSLRSLGIIVGNLDFNHFYRCVGEMFCENKLTIIYESRSTLNSI